MANAKTAVRVDAPGEIEPELVLLPDLAGVHLARVFYVLALAFTSRTQHRLAKTEPLRVVRFVRMNVVAFRAQTHRQYVVGEVRRFVPGGRERHMTTDPVFVCERLDPGEAVRVGPDRVVHACEINFQPPSS